MRYFFKIHIDMISLISDRIKTMDDIAAPLLTSEADVKEIYDRIAGIEYKPKSKQIHIEHGNKKVFPCKKNKNNFVFMLPEGFEKFDIVFNRIRMSDIVGPWNDDRREIEVTSSGLTRSDNNNVEITSSKVNDDTVVLSAKSNGKPCMLSVTF